MPASRSTRKCREAVDLLMLSGIAQQLFAYMRTMNVSKPLLIDLRSLTPTIEQDAPSTSQLSKL
jgi:hypothetical protein